MRPGMRGCTRRNLFRIHHFYDGYSSDAIVSALPKQLPETRTDEAIA